jgi:hypothetical protein
MPLGGILIHSEHAHRDRGRFVGMARKRCLFDRDGARRGMALRAAPATRKPRQATGPRWRTETPAILGLAIAAGFVPRPVAGLAFGPTVAGAARDSLRGRI